MRVKVRQVEECSQNVVKKKAENGFNINVDFINGD
jgi:hypothetical protein